MGRTLLCTKYLSEPVTEQACLPKALVNSCKQQYEPHHVWQGAPGWSLGRRMNGDNFWRSLASQYKTSKSSMHPPPHWFLRSLPTFHDWTCSTSLSIYNYGYWDFLPRTFVFFHFGPPVFLVPWGAWNRSGCKSAAPQPDSNPSGQVLSCQSREKPDSGTECCIFSSSFWHGENAFGLSSPKRGWMQVLGSAVDATQEPSNPWARCNNCTVHVPLERCFKAAASQLAEALARDFWTHTGPFLKR